MSESDAYRSGGQRDVVRPPRVAATVGPHRGKGLVRGDAIAPAEDDSTAGVRRAAERVLSLAAQLRGLAHESVAVATRVHEEAADSAGRTSAARVRGAAEETAAATAAAVRVLIARARALAPGLAAATWDEALWRSPEWPGAGLPDALRLGGLSAARRELPALLPVRGSAGCVVSGPSDDALKLLQGLLLRLVATAPAGGLELSAYDPRVRGELGAFAPLRRVGLFPEPVVAPTSLYDLLQQRLSAVAEAADRLGAAGARDLAELRRRAGRALVPDHVLVVLDYPSGVDERAQEALLTLARGAAGRGLFLLVHHDPSIAPQQRVDPAAVLALLTRVECRDGHWRCHCPPGFDVVPDGAPPRALVDRTCGAVADAAMAGGAPVLDLAPLLPPPNRRWSLDATDGICVAFGVDGTDEVVLELRSGNPALPNLLVGGAVGQGKSNLLLVLLHAIGAAYSPDDVHMYLLDFKHGVEFDRLGPGEDRPYWLPHVRLLGLESDREFGVAVLEDLTAEFSRRADLFKSASASDLGAFRRARPDEAMPRVLLVVDEFQVLLGGNDDLAREATRLLETLARQGRAYGIHLVLASQTLSGMESLALKQDSIFGQFPHRLALKTTEAESQVVLGQGNTAAGRLRFRGEAVFNSDFGAVASNRRMTVAYADAVALDRLREELWYRAATAEPPRRFRGTSAARLGELLREVPPVAGTDPAAWLGAAVTARPEPAAVLLGEDPGRGLAVVGEGPDDAVGVLCAAAATVACQRPSGTVRVVALDLMAGGAGPSLEALRDAVTGMGQRLDVVERGGASAELAALYDRVRDETLSGTTLVLGLGMHRLLRPAVASGGGVTTPLDAVRALVSDGPLHGVFLLGWWNSLKTCEDQLGFGFSGMQPYLFLRVPQADVQRVAGPFVHWESRRHRALLYDPGAIEQIRLVVPFAHLDAADVGALVDPGARYG